MYIYDGGNMLSDERAQLTGVISDPFFSTGRDIYLKFLSDGTKTKTGFQIQFESGKTWFG